MAYLPYATTHTCALCGKSSIVKDEKRVWSIGFLYHFLSSVCKPSPFVYVVLMSMVYRSLKNKTWQEDQVVLCKDCMDWALQVCTYDEGLDQWVMIGNKIKFKRRNTKSNQCAFLPMDMMMMFLHAPSENRQLEYRMMCRLLKLLSLGPNKCLYAQMPFPILQAVIHGIQVGNIVLRKKTGIVMHKDSNADVPYFMAQSIAMNVIMAYHKASGEKRLVRNAPDVAKYIRKCGSLLSRHEQKQAAWNVSFYLLHVHVFAIEMQLKCN